MPSSPSLAPSAVSSRGSLSARPLLGRSHAWLVRKPDLVWQILTDFLGGRTGNPSRSSFKRALRKGISAPPTTRTNEPRSQVSYRRYFARSSAAEGALLFGLMRLVGMQISSLSCRLFADGPTDARSERKAAGRKTTRAGAREVAEQPTWFHGKIWRRRSSFSPSVSSSAIWLILCLRAPFVRRPPLPT